MFFQIFGRLQCVLIMIRKHITGTELAHDVRLIKLFNHKCLKVKIDHCYACELDESLGLHNNESSRDQCRQLAYH